eukprot:740130-Hanusia_phi.AAC.2
MTAGKGTHSPDRRTEQAPGRSQTTISSALLKLHPFDRRGVSCRSSRRIPFTVNVLAFLACWFPTSEHDARELNLWRGSPANPPQSQAEGRQRQQTLRR